ncbi:MAG: Phosphatidylinositol 4-kinase type 2-beta [Bogoriella megaspora]|nr:MAG: Phosphatidylinositol 4-kinase type 2-beta [Bogoriella megaspora]
MPQPKINRNASGYARIAQAEEEQGLIDDSEDEDPFQPPTTLSTPGATSYEPIQPKRNGGMRGPGSPGRRKMLPGQRRTRSNSGVDIKAINARLERWAEEIAQKFTRRNRIRNPEDDHLEIHHSVFQAPEWVRPATPDVLTSDQLETSGETMTKLEFDDIVERVRVAIELGVHPKLITQGSSGSYFAKDSQGKTVAVFKPKDEEPYASRNPKWTKWIHRNLFPFFFGRACLIPNLSYVSEAAAYILDARLRTHLVPYTDIVSLSSKAFHYDYWDRRQYYRKKKPLPHKVGSFQIFLKGFKDANIFLKEHPWPDQHNSGFRTDSAPKKKRRWSENCRKSASYEDESEDDQPTPRPNSSHSASRRREFWTENLQLAFREQLEKLVILDYIMRNTDRGLDNWMIKIDPVTEEASIVAEPPKSQSHENLKVPNSHTNGSAGGDEQYTREEQMRAGSPASAVQANVRVGAIDNSLSWPWKHPDADSDFKERMFARQMAVMKGQAWNVVETLKQRDHGPLELTRRTRVCVWDDVVDIPVAVPLRVPSSEMRRREAEDQMRESIEEEEFDIGTQVQTAPATTKPAPDLLSLSPPNPARSAANRFNVSRQASSTNVHASEAANGSLSPTASKTIDWAAHRTSSDLSPTSVRSQRPSNQRSKTRFSLETPRRRAFSPEARRRRFSLGGNRGLPDFGVEDEDEGDLGYAAAEDMEGNRRRVIVERLETVKSKNPVFTWC